MGNGEVVSIDLSVLRIKSSHQLSHKSARALALSPQTGELAVGFSDDQIRILGLDDFEAKFVLSGHNNSVFAINYSQDHRYLFSGSRDAHLKIWDRQNDYRLMDDIVAHMYAINHITFSPDYNYFVTCSMDKSIKVWDAKAFKLLKVIDKSRHAGHGTSVNKLLWSPFENYLLSASDDRSIAVWDINIKTEL